MPTCARCGAYSPDTAVICQKCSVPFGSQLRAQAGQAKQRQGTILRGIVWVAILIALVVAAPGAFHAGNAAYQKFHYNSVKANAMKSCGGPVTDSMPSYQATTVNDCLAKDEDFTKAKLDFAAFEKSQKN